MSAKKYIINVAHFPTKRQEKEQRNWTSFILPTTFSNHSLLVVIVFLSFQAISTPLSQPLETPKPGKYFLPNRFIQNYSLSHLLERSHTHEKIRHYQKRHARSTIDKKEIISDLNNAPENSHHNQNEKSMLPLFTITPSVTTEMNPVNEGHYEREKYFPRGYWVRIAQAKAMSLVVEDGIVPQLDPVSGIMNPAECDGDERCKDFIDTCAEDQANILLEYLEHVGEKDTEDNVSLYISHILKECGIENIDRETYEEKRSEISTTSSSSIPHPVPIFHCNSYLNTTNVITNFRMAYKNSSGFPVDNFNRSNGLIPRYFVVEFIQRNEEESFWEMARHPIQKYWLFRFSTRADQRYQIRVTSVSPKYVYPPVTSPILRVYKSSEIILNKPINVHLSQIAVDEKKTDQSRVNALLHWESGSGDNASCNYDVFIMDEDVHKIERKSGYDAFWIQMRHLNFRRHYNVQIIEKIGVEKEAGVSSELRIPSCLELKGFSFEFCPPPPPSNLRIENPTDQSFSVAWNEPKYANKTNPIISYNVTIEIVYVPAVRNPPAPDGFILGSFPSTSMIAASYYPEHHASSQLKTRNIFREQVTGNVTSIHIKNATTIRGQLKISIVAIGSAGPSLESGKFVQYFGAPLGSKWTLGNVLAGLSALSTVVALITLLCVLKHNYEKRQRQLRRREMFENYEKETCERQQNFGRNAAKWEIDCCSLTLGDAIGQGQFGLVRKAMLNLNGVKTIVAVKTLRDDVQGREVERFWEEFEILRNLDPHLHVVGLKGIVTKHVPKPLLVVEYCDGGDLQSHLRKFFKTTRIYAQYFTRTPRSSNLTYDNNATEGSEYSCSLNYSENSVQLRQYPQEAYFRRKYPSASNVGKFSSQKLQLSKQPLSTLDLLSYAKQIATGMEYLSMNKILHRDLAARNILISKQNGKKLILKISDFGLSRDVYENNWYKKSSNGKVPIKWMAIECILNDIYTTKSDVWSFGVLLWEIFTFGGNPYPGIENARVFDMIRSGYRMPRPDACPTDVYELMRLCWDDEPVKRPDFTGLRLILEDMIEKAEDSPDSKSNPNSLEEGSNYTKSSSCYATTPLSDDDGFHDGHEEYAGI